MRGLGEGGRREGIEGRETYQYTGTHTVSPTTSYALFPCKIAETVHSKVLEVILVTLNAHWGLIIQLEFGNIIWQAHQICPFTVYTGITLSVDTSGR